MVGSSEVALGRGVGEGHLQMWEGGGHDVAQGGEMREDRRRKGKEVPRGGVASGESQGLGSAVFERRTSEAESAAAAKTEAVDGEAMR